MKKPSLVIATFLLLASAFLITPSVSAQTTGDTNQDTLRSVVGFLSNYLTNLKQQQATVIASVRSLTLPNTVSTSKPTSVSSQNDKSTLDSCRNNLSDCNVRVREEYYKCDDWANDVRVSQAERNRRDLVCKEKEKQGYLMCTLDFLRCLWPDYPVPF